MRLDPEGRIDGDLCRVDGTHMRAWRSAAGAGNRGDPENPRTTPWVAREAGWGRSSRGSLAVTEPPLGDAVSAGQEHESTHLEEALGAVDLPDAWTAPRCVPGALAGDKAQTGERSRGRLEVLGVRPVTAPLSGEPQKPWAVPFDPEAYRKRNIIERVVGYRRECRRVATRFEKLALIERCLRISCSYGT